MFTDRDRDDRTARSDESQATAQPTEPAESAETETTKTETSMASRDEGEESSIVTPPARRSFLDTDESGVSEVRDADEPAQATDPLRAETLANAPSPAGDVTDMTEEDVSPAVGSDVVMGEGPAEEVAPLTTPNTQPAMAAAQTKPAATPQTHTLEPGDTFTALAVEYFGHAKYATRIMQANPDLDPRRLRIGTEITIPTIPEAAPSQSPATESTAVASPAPARPEPAQPSEPRVITTTGGLRVVQPSDAGPAPIPEDRAYTVQPGEGWYQLAQRFFGDSSQWTRLYELNRERVPTDPNMLQAGTVIELPQGVQATQSGG
jgi:nucleoid-associated protein YgaU